MSRGRGDVCSRVCLYLPSRVVLFSLKRLFLKDAMNSSLASPSDPNEAQNSEQAHEANLKGQLDSLQRIRSVVARLNSSLDRAKANLDVSIPIFA